jgi:hypothetical protein
VVVSASAFGSAVAAPSSVDTAEQAVADSVITDTNNAVKILFLIKPS